MFVLIFSQNMYDICIKPFLGSTKLSRTLRNITLKFLFHSAQINNLFIIDFLFCFVLGAYIRPIGQVRPPLNLTPASLPVSESWPKSWCSDNQRIKMYYSHLTCYIIFFCSSSRFKAIKDIIQVPLQIPPYIKYFFFACIVVFSLVYRRQIEMLCCIWSAKVCCFVIIKFFLWSDC